MACVRILTWTFPCDAVASLSTGLLMRTGAWWRMETWSTEDGEWRMGTASRPQYQWCLTKVQIENKTYINI